MADILIIDDDVDTNAVLAAVAKKSGHRTKSAFTIGDGLKLSKSVSFDIILLDVYLPDGSGLDILPEIRKSESLPEVIIITGFGDPDGAELAIREGAWDYLLKPASMDNINLAINRAVEYRKSKKANARPFALKRDRIIGTSRKLNSALDRVAFAASSDANVLITGETGTGKELFSRAVHENSPRKNKRFVVVDCAALPESLVESTLFGHSKGAFTGADSQRDGLIKQADGGTLFLDEIGELTPSIQKSFLRVLQEKSFRPVRGEREVKVNFRLIAATNKDLDKMVKEKQFRSDLLFRLRAITIEVPTLRERMKDIKRLTFNYIERLCDIYGTDTKGVSPDFMNTLNAYKWPGNVRELFHTLEEALSIAGNEPILHTAHLPLRIRIQAKRDAVQATTCMEKIEKPQDFLNKMTTNNFLKFSEFKNQMERIYLERLTILTNGSRKESCRISCLSRTRLFELLKKHKLSKSLRKSMENGNHRSTVKTNTSVHEVETTNIIPN